MDFLEDIRQHVLSTLPCTLDARAELEDKDARELLIIWRNWLDRLISPVRRKVHHSQVLASNPLLHEYQDAVAYISRALESGSDLTPNLSRSIIHGYQPADEDDNRKRLRKDLDLMLNDWRIHHLHLSTEVGRNGFVRRTGPLLFTFIGRCDAYLIDIVDHGSWTRRHLFEVMVREWPNAGLAHEVRGVMGLAHPVSEEDHKTLRNKHVNTLIEVDGKVYMPAGGMASVGTPISATIAADRLLDTLEEAQELIASDPSFFPNILRENGVTPPANLDLHFTFLSEGGYGLLERNSGVALKLSD